MFVQVPKGYSENYEQTMNSSCKIYLEKEAVSQDA